MLLILYVKDVPFMLREQKLKALIKNHKESELVDFKQEFYHKEKTQDLIKDIVSFANASDNEEKYIIFGVDDDSNILEVDYDSIRDISEINQILKEYCEPYIKVELHRFTYNEKKLLALVIFDNADRPYLIKKDYKKKGDTLLRAGDIYIRHGATNFKANRDDLDSIYENREKIQLVVKDNLIQFINLRHGHKKEKVGYLQILIDNNSNKSIVVHNGSIHWQYHNTDTESPIVYIEQMQDGFSKELTNINVKPFQLQAHSQYQAMLFVKVSDGMIEIIKNKELEKEKLTISINLFDALDNEMKFSALIDSIIYNLDN